MEMIQIAPINSNVFRTPTINAFVERDLAFLIAPSTGTTMCVSKTDDDQLMNGAVEEGLIFVMTQRGLASYAHSREITNDDPVADPYFFLIDITKACNLNCSYCFRTSKCDSMKMTPEQIDKITDALIENGKNRPLSIQIWGGEPLLGFPLIRRMRQRFTDCGMHPQISIETNGTLIDRRTARLLKKFDIKVGISIDGNRTVHDMQRPYMDGRSSLVDVERGIRCLRAAGIRGFGTITVVTKNTVEHLPGILKYFAEELHLHAVKFNLMRKTDYNRDLALDLSEIGPYLDTLLTELHNLYEKGIEIVEHNISQRISNLLFRPCDNICCANGCHGGYKMLSIDAEGKVFPCEMSDHPELCIGTVGEMSFADMINKAVKDQNKYFDRPHDPKCRTCPWYFYCRGGCRAAMMFDPQNTASVDLTECTLNRELYPRLVRILMTDEAFGRYLLGGGNCFERFIHRVRI